MQRQRGIFDIFPETVDLNLGPDSNSRGINESDEFTRSLSPTERRLLSNDLSGELNFSRVNASDRYNSRSFSSWDVGESSSRANPQDQVANDGLKLEHNWSSPFGTHDSRFKDGQFDSSNSQPRDSFGGSGSNRIPMDVDLNIGYRGNSSNDGGQGMVWGNSTHPSDQQPPIMHVSGTPRNILPFPWSGNVDSRHGSSSSSELPRESGPEANFRITLRNNETRNLVQDPTNWSGASGRANAASGSRSHPSNSGWMPHLNSTTQGLQRLSEFSPWTLFPSPEAESVGHGGHLSPFPTGRSSSTAEENVISSGVNSPGRHHQPFLRSASLMEVPGDEWQDFAADMEGRHRLVSEMRQILNALRRGENLRAEDYVLFDPFINGVADLHDRHRDMRLDVDNMSYEELLALEERIGDVKTGLNEEVILKSMKQRKHISFMGIPTSNLEPCCICREEYGSGDDIGSLDCGHDFHTHCIKQWLAHKNVCPICKMTALST